MAEARPRRRWTGTVAVLPLLALAGGGAWWFYFRAPEAKQAAAAGESGGEEGDAKKDQAVPVTLAEARSGSFPVTLTGLGTVQAVNSVTVRAQISGQILHILFKEGQMVNQGDLLVEIDPRPLQAALAQAQAKLAQDQASVEDAKVNLGRIQDLAKKEFASRQQLDTQTAVVDQGNAQVQSDQAAIADAQTRLGYASIRAPLPGRVGFRLADVGTIVSPSDAEGIVNIQQVRPIAVIFNAAEESLGAITRAIGAGVPPVTALSSDGTVKLAQGRLTRINNEVDVASGTIRLKAVFPNEKDELWPGQSVSTELLVETLENATVVPALALQHGPDGLFVYVVGDDRKAEMRKVEIGPENAEEAVVLDGLKPGERVVTAGQYRLQNGILTAEDKPPGGAAPEQKAEGDGAGQQQAAEE